MLYQFIAIRLSYEWKKRGAFLWNTVYYNNNYYNYNYNNNNYYYYYYYNSDVGIIVSWS